jgi:hypothetical protein
VGVLIFFLPEFLFILFWGACKVSNSYDMPLLGFSNGGKKNNKKRKICKIVAYGCQTPSAQRRSDQFFLYTQVSKGDRNGILLNACPTNMQSKPWFPID